MRSLIATTLVGICMMAAASQQIGQNASPDNNQNFKITVSTRLVVETVVVKDKQGNPIDGLTAKDFTVTEDGVPQTIRFCERQQLPETVDATPSAQSEPEDIKLYRELPHTQISPEAPEKRRYQDRRLMALYFDMTAMQPAE